MKRYPMLLKPISKEIIWGGNRLKNEYGKTAPFENIAESWELSVRSKEMCLIDNGTYSGKSMEDIISFGKTEVLGTLSEKYDRFPLLIKFIDAASDLSIQVHPDNEYSLENEGELGKTEMWYIIDALPGAKIVYGLKDGIDKEAFAKAVHEDKTEDALNYVEVKKGDVFFIPAGQVHAIGAGILIAEIQQNSDVTYRVYDYKRKQPDGSYRQLHIEKAIDVIKQRDTERIDEIRFSQPYQKDGKVLASCEYFVSREYNAMDSIQLNANSDSFMSILVLEDNDAKIVYKKNEYNIKKGQSWFIPAGTGNFDIKGQCHLIVTEIH